MNSYQTRVH
ncbi:unnamed protein product [Amaranthus hypochondriacus]